MTAEAAPKNVTEAIARIMLELPAIGRDHSASAQQGGYKYRGIEDITTKAQMLCGKYGVAFFPQGEITEIRELVVNGKPWTDTVLSVLYEVCHGPSDTSKIVKVPGIGRDNSDKGSNKGMTQAFKYALIQVFMISDTKDDSDGTTVEADSKSGARSTASRPAPQADPVTGEIASTGDVATMNLQELTLALQEAGLPLTGNTEAKRARLAEHRLVSVGSNGATDGTEPFG
ncbi:MAG: hypothetical protein JWO62_1653 [Acidimicrobiaceae bacterium]|nr:hypothetical protein [Acidimicrobiaceae bacterium]